MKGFRCKNKKCRKTFVPGPGTGKIYDNDLCMMCREKAGEKNFTEEEKTMLEFEKLMFEKNQGKMIKNNM